MSHRALRWSVSLLLMLSSVCTVLLGMAAGENRTVWRMQSSDEKVQEPAESAAGVLEGWTIAVDAGHGGYDGGAVGRKSGVPEKGINLDVAQRLEKMLRAMGASVVMTRTDDYALCDADPPIRKKLQDMQRRAALIEAGGAQMVLSIHMNEYAKSSQSGPQVFYREGCDAGRLLAGVMQEALIDGLSPARERSAMSGDFYILMLGVPSVLIECGFLSNPQEEALLLTKAYRQRIAESIAQGVLSWASLDARPQALEKRADLQEN